MLRIRLTRHGAKKDPHYRVVVAERASPRDGSFVEVVGYYNPALKPVRLHLDLERIRYWITKGAQPTNRVKFLMNKSEQVTRETETEQESSSSSSST